MALKSYPSYHHYENYLNTMNTYGKDLEELVINGYILSRV